MKELENIIINNPNIKYVYDIVNNEILNNKTELTNDFFKEHILVCTYYAYLLGKRNNFDLEIITIAALLHDFARRKPEWINSHEYYGAMEAEMILNSIDYDKSKIEIIKEAIIKHQLGKRTDISKEAQVIADADAISYIQKIDFFANYLIDNNVEEDNIKNIVELKIKDCCDKMSSEAFELVKDDISVIGQRLYEPNLIVKIKKGGFYGKY